MSGSKAKACASTARRSPPACATSPAATAKTRISGAPSASSTTWISKSTPTSSWRRTVTPSSASPTCASNGWGETVCRAILSHADYSGVEPESALEKTLCAVDELSGFVIAVALVRPDKSIHQVEVKSVRKKMKDKAFAAKVSREEIVHGAERLGVPLDELIAEVIAALRVEAPRLGVDGAPAPIA